MARGRKSGASLVVVPLVPGQGRPEPPADLDSFEQEAWRQVVAALPAHWIDPAGQIVLAAQPRNVDSVWVDGIALKRGGELVGIDVPGLVRDVQEAVQGLSRRIGKDVV